MALNATKRKALGQILQASSRNKITDQQLEELANDLIEEKTTLNDASEYFGISKQTLKKRLSVLAEGARPVAEA